MKAIFKLLRLIAHLFKGYWIIRVQFPRLSTEQKAHQVTQWSAQLVSIVGLQIFVRGAPVQQGLLVANHLSWLDNVVIHAAHFCRFIAKADIQKWPFIGYMTRQSHMLFIQRTSRKDSHRLVNIVAKRLLVGDCIAVFPESTTGDGKKLLPFHANLLQSAIDAQAVVQPIAIRYVNTLTGQPSFAPLFFGKDTLVQSIWRTLQTNHLGVILDFGAAEFAHGRDRRAWAQDLRYQIEIMLQQASLHSDERTA